MNDTIDISKLNKADVLAALYNNSQPQGLGFLHATKVDMKTEEAQEIIDNSNSNYFDYVQGRIIKTNIGQDELNPVLYDRDNGEGAAARALSGLTT